MILERARLARRGLPLIVPLLLAIGLLLVVPSPADAATLVVTSTGHELSQNGQCTLLEALDNAHTDSVTRPDCPPIGAFSAVDTIAFNIPNCPSGVCVIAPSFGYVIQRPVIIDGYTQPGASPNTLAVGTNAVVRIVISGANGASRAFGIEGDDITVKGLAIVACSEYAIDVGGGARARIQGNYIGTQADGSTAAANSLAGIRVQQGVTATQIGGTSPGDRNVISGNDTYGAYGILLASSSGATIQGNYIGLKANGIDPLPNYVGISSDGAFNNTIGGTALGARNVISGNDIVGITLKYNPLFVVVSNVVQGNYIGPRADGTSGFTSNGNGVIIESSGNTIGGTTPSAGNVIKGNALANVKLYEASPGVTTGNAILGNSIAGSSGLGIDLTPNVSGPTPNDVGDGDGGPNNLQNFPVLQDVGVRVNTTVHGDLNSTPNRNFRIELFSNTTCGGSFHGEGETILGVVNVTTNSTGNVSFIAIFPPVQVGQFITSTATLLDGNGAPVETSEFSECDAASLTGFVVSNVTAPTTEANEGAPYDTSIAVQLTSRPTANVTVPLSISDPTEGRLVTQSPLTFTPANGTNYLDIRLLGVDDGIDDNNVPYTLVLGPASSADPNYHGLDPADRVVTNIDDDDRPTQCNPTRPQVHVSVAKIGPGQLRATVTVSAKPSTQNELVSIAWTRFDTAMVVLDGVGPVQVGQTSTFPVPLTQSASFVITRTPGAQAGVVRLIVKDACGDWITFVGGGPGAW